MAERDCVKRDCTANAYQRLKKEIISGKRLPGEIFNEKSFAEQLGISRTPVREAVLRLSQEGLLTIMPRQGTIVSHISFRDICQLYQVRKLLEPQIVKLAAEAVDQKRLKEWIAFFQCQSRQPDDACPVSRFPENMSGNVLDDCDALFHIFLAESTENRFLIREMEELMTQTQRIRCLSNSVRKDRFQAAKEEHIQIAAALEKRDGEDAARRMLEHLENSEAGYSKIYDLHQIDWY
ncbi:MAG: GntR family transcriptional regulator [Lachnospiraceae bacterium]|nr:GntR family transcriptional regulator [Lachnospiraceae bacterium]